jgi:hypothetical protein
MSSSVTIPNLIDYTESLSTQANSGEFHNSLAAITEENLNFNDILFNTFMKSFFTFTPAFKLGQHSILF